MLNKLRTIKPNSLLLLFLISGFSSASHAVLIDFNAFSGVNIGNGVLTPLQIIDDEFSADGIFFGRSGVSAGVGVINNEGPDGSQAVSGLDAGGLISSVGTGCCTGDIFFNFLGVTDFVSFDIGDFGGDTDNFQVRVFSEVDVLLSSLNYSGDSFADIGTVSIAMAGIHRIEIDFDDTNEFGYFLDNVNFNPVVPVPAAAWLFGSGLIGLIGVARRKKV